MERYSHGDIATIERDNWWYRARRDVLKRQFARLKLNDAVIVDLGCGVGANAKLLRPYARELVGIDVAADALTYAAREPYDRLIESDASQLPFRDASVDCILVADVLEHLDDRVALREAKRVLRPGGFIVATVPAFASLWNENDDYGQHLRRYRPREFRALLVESGFLIRHFAFWNFTFIVPAWLVARLYRKKPEGTLLHNNLSRVPRLADSLILAWMNCEAALAAYVPLPIGVSLIAVAQLPV